MKAVIIYDEVASAARALIILQRALLRTELRTEWDVKPWRAGMLNLAITAEEALREAVDAEVIVLADLGGRWLQTGLIAWLERWSVRRHEGPSTIVVTRSARDDEPFAVSQELSSFATRNNLDLIIEAISPVGKHPITSALFPSKAELLAPEVSEQPPSKPAASNPDKYRDWGINE